MNQGGIGIDKQYFFDTYALYGLIIGKDSYKKYSKDIVLITTKMNLMELHYSILRKFSKEIADRYYDKLIGRCIQISDEDIKNASQIKYKLRKLKISYVDALGYTIAKTRGMKFLTGDKAFKGLSGVEFVK